MRSDVYIVGIGIRGTSEITPETELVLRRSKEIFYMDPRPLISRYINRINRNSHNLQSRYMENRRAYDVYEEISSLVVNSALERPGACYATYGNPIIYDTIVKLILQKANRRGLSVEILPAVSALDTVLVDLKLPILDQGLQIFEANRLVLFKEKMNASFPCLVFGAGSFGTVVITLKRRNTAQRYLPMQMHLLKFYPTKHPVYLVESSLHPDMPSRITRTVIDRLGRMYRRINYNTTLFIPSIPKAKRLNKDFDSKIHSRRWLSKIVGK